LRDALLSQLLETPMNGSLDAHFRIANDMYQTENLLAMYNTLGSHDTRRLFTLLRGNMNKTRLAYALLFAYPGAPAIYYGDEIGLRGGKDPANRAGFPWDDAEWNHELRDWVKQLIRLRKEQAALRRGKLELLAGDHDKGLVAFLREHENERVVAVFNFGDAEQSWSFNLDEVSWPASGMATDLLSGEGFEPREGMLELKIPAYGARWLAPAENQATK
jgi:glycosidase